MIPEPPDDWRERAECRGTDPAWFYAEVLRGRPPTNPEAQQVYYAQMRWRQLCPSCPVRAHCLAHAILHRERWGVWGGLTPAARRNVEVFLVDGVVSWEKLTAKWSNNGSGCDTVAA